MSLPNCPLCQTSNAPFFFKDSQRDYFRCKTCHLIFVPSHQYLSPKAEKAEYDLHQNSPEDVGYRRFLSRLFSPMQARLSPTSQGLDFGAGPGPTLSVMFEEAGHTMAIYDPFYANDVSLFEQTYDFITASEVVEHLHHPLADLNRLWECLRPNGFFGLMTKLALDKAAFAQWHYKNDLTHVCFFSRETFQWLADTWQAEMIFVDKDVTLFRKVRG
ncbi:MAG: class I SAM-dependent methyltransferase [Chloroflexota bacterium]